MLKVILTKGLPASGKTTWAKELIEKEPGRWKRINKDDLRAMFDNGRWSRQNEDWLLKMQYTMAIDALQNGWSVIIDDTNLSPKHEARMKEMVSFLKSKSSIKKVDVQLEVKDFTDVPPEVCIERDLERANSVGSKVIMQMYNQFLKPKPRPVLGILNGKYAIICDLDGTLCLFGNENPYDRDFMKDTLNFNVARILKDTSVDHIYFVSGRSDKHRKVTLDWLAKNLEKVLMTKNHSLHMRKDGDVRKDSIVKEEIFVNEIEGKYNIEFVLDDRNQMVEKWRSLGLTCLQVAEGDF